MISFLVAAAAALAAVVATGLLARECARSPRLEVVPWLVAAAGLAIGLAAVALGFKQGFGPGTFRGVQFGAQLLAPLALAWGLVEVTGQSLAARFAARLVLAGFFVVASVIVATDPLNASTPFTSAWPAASQHYLFLPNYVLLAVAGGTVLAAVVAVAVAGARRSQGPGGPGAFAAAGAGGSAAVVVQMLRLPLPLNAAYPAVCLLAIALTWFAGSRSDVSQVAAGGARGRYDDEDEDDYGGLYRPGDTGGYRRYQDDTGYGQDSGYGPGGADTGYGQDSGYGPGGADTGYGTYGGRDISDTGYGFYRDDTGGLRAISDTGYGLYRDDTGSMVFSDGPGGANGASGPGGANGAFGPGGANGAFGPGDTGFGLAMAGDQEGTDRLYGQIAIYTLLEGRAEEFDRLAQEVVAKVKAREPETLVFVMHGVPSAPMQRILYEVYRDQAAYEEHAEQSYVREWEERRKPYVLATNVIELGVRQAKVSPLAPGDPAQPEPAAPRSRPPAQPEPPRSRRPAQPEPPRQQADPLRAPADPLRSHTDPLRSYTEPPRSHTDPPRSAPPADQPRQRQAAPSRRPAPPPPEPDESGFWTGSPADTPDDGDFWTRGNGYR